MSSEQIIAVSVGCIALPALYWWGFVLAFRAGENKAVRELARLKLDDDPNFEWVMVNEMNNILEERISKKAYEIE